MEPRRSWGALALLFLLLPRGHPSPCQVFITPQEPVVEFGTPFLLNCTSSCHNYSRLDWEVSVTKLGGRGPGWVSLSVPNVTDRRLELQCYANFGGGQRLSATTTLHAFRLTPPQISLEGEVVAGKETRVTCNMSAWMPPPGPHNLLLTLWGGGLPPITRRGPSVGLVFTAGPEQHWGVVTCDATLQFGDRTVNASATLTLWVWAAPHHVQAWASRTLFAAGDNLTVTCQAEGNPLPQLHWELPTNASLDLGDNGTSVTILAAQREHGGTYRCLAKNFYGTSAASVHILFQGPSSSPLIPVVVILVVVTLLVLLASSWWLHRARAWKAILHISLLA